MQLLTRVASRFQPRVLSSGPLLVTARRVEGLDI